MNTDADIWIGFASTLGMLFVVLAFFLLAFYLFRKVSGGMTGKGPGDLIRVMAVHHLSPKEKLVLVRVHNETLFIGVTPSQISKLADIGHDAELEARVSKSSTGFSDLLGRTLKKGDFLSPDGNRGQANE